MSALHPIYRRSPEVVAANLGSKSFLLHINEWVYLELNDSGGAIWSLLEDGSTMESITEQIQAEFDVAPDVCVREAREFLQVLEEKHFVLAA